MTTLRALQADANHANSSAPLTWRAINSMGRSTGSPVVDYNAFSARWEQEGETGILHQVVDRFDKNGLVLKTTVQEPSVTQPKEKESQISKMAKHALKK